MLEKLAALPLVAFIVIIEPLRAIAQQTAPQPPQDYLPPHSYFAHGPWGMWHYGYGWHFLVDVPTDDAVHDFNFRCHLFSRPWFMRPWLPSLGTALANVG